MTWAGQAASRGSQSGIGVKPICVTCDFPSYLLLESWIQVKLSLREFQDIWGRSFGCVRGGDNYDNAGIPILFFITSTEFF